MELRRPQDVILFLTKAGGKLRGGWGRKKTGWGHCEPKENEGLSLGIQPGESTRNE